MDLTENFEELNIKEALLKLNAFFEKSTYFTERIKQFDLLYSKVQGIKEDCPEAKLEAVALEEILCAAVCTGYVLDEAQEWQRKAQNGKKRL